MSFSPACLAAFPRELPSYRLFPPPSPSCFLPPSPKSHLGSTWARVFISGKWISLSPRREAGPLRELERIITQSKQRSAQEHQPLSGSHTALSVCLNSLLTGRGRRGINGLLWLSLDLWPLMSPEDKWEDGAVKQEEVFFFFFSNVCYDYFLKVAFCSGFIHAYLNLLW